MKRWNGGFCTPFTHCYWESVGYRMVTGVNALWPKSMGIFVGESKQVLMSRQLNRTSFALSFLSLSFGIPRNVPKSPISSHFPPFREEVWTLHETLTIPANLLTIHVFYWRCTKSSINSWEKVWCEFPPRLSLRKRKKMMKTTATYSPMNACRNPKVSARNVVEYLVVSNNMLPTNQPTNHPLSVYSESDFIRWGDRPAGCVACDASCRFVFGCPVSCHSSLSVSFLLHSVIQSEAKNLGNTKKRKTQRRMKTWMLPRFFTPLRSVLNDKW